MNSHTRQMNDLKYYTEPKYCKQGHQLTEKNTYTYLLKGKPYHKCRTCSIEYARRRRHHKPKINQDELAQQIAEVQLQLEHAMPWERHDMKLKLQQLVKQQSP